MQKSAICLADVPAAAAAARLCEIDAINAPWWWHDWCLRVSRTTQEGRAHPCSHPPCCSACMLCCSAPHFSVVSCSVHCTQQGFSDRMYPFLYDAQTGVQYEEVVREHTLGAPLSSSAAKHFAPASTELPKQPVQFQDGAKEAAQFEANAKTKVLFLVTPKLAAFARDYYACPSLPGAPADAFSEGSHWRQANVNHELMQPASAEDSQRKRISAFTLNFLDDTGWYVTDKSAAQELEWGRGAGCSFVLDGCGSWATSNTNKQSYYCSESQAGKDVCTHDNRGIGTCSAIPGTLCFTARADAAKPLLYCQDSNSFARSGRQGVAAAFKAVGGAVGSQSSRCLNTAQKLCTGSACAGDAGAAICADTSCDASGKLYVELNVGGKSSKLPCTDGEFGAVVVQCCLEKRMLVTRHAVQHGQPAWSAQQSPASPTQQRPPFHLLTSISTTAH